MELNRLMDFTWQSSDDLEVQYGVNILGVELNCFL